MDRVKPFVHYKRGTLQPAKPALGMRMLCVPIDHTNHVPGQHVTNTGPIITSPVVRIISSGAFETENTRYVPR